MTVQHATALHIKDVRKNMIIKGAKISGTASIGKNTFKIDTDWTGTTPTVRLRYATADGMHYDYSITVEVRRSNLGRGEVMYFHCPESHRLCRTLYMAYNYPRFKARTAYRLRLYYVGQLTGGRSRYNDLYWKAEKELEELKKQRQYYTYNGQETKRLKRLQSLTERIDDLDYLRWTAGLPAVVARFMA